MLHHPTPHKPSPSQLVYRDAQIERWQRMGLLPKPRRARDFIRIKPTPAQKAKPAPMPVKKPDPRPFTPKPGLPAAHIIAMCAKRHDVSVAEIQGRTRAQEVVMARWEAAYLIRTKLGYSFPHIGKLLGGRDHTTVLHAYRKQKAKIEAYRAAEDDPRDWMRV